MKIKIPFTNSTLYLGQKAVESAKRSLGYGVYRNFGSSLGSGGRVSFNVLYSIYNDVVDVKQSIRKIQNSVMKEGYTFVDINDSEKEGNPKEVARANEVLDQNGLSFSTLKDLWVRDICVAGNHYWHYEPDLMGNVIRLNPVDPRTMAIISDKYGDVMGYKQSLMGHEAIVFNKDEIQHSVMDFSTYNALLGISPIEAIVLDAKTEIEAQKTNFYFYENQAVPAHLLILGEDLDDEQMDKLKENIDKKYKGAKNAFKSAIIPHVKDIKTITPSQKDMNYIESRMFTTKKVVVAFGVDSFILGYTEKVQRGNAGIIYKNFYEHTVRPYEVYFEEVMNNEVLPKLGLTNIRFKVNVSNYDSKVEVADITRNDVIAGIMTINEARQLRGLDESDNELADELLFQGYVLDDMGEEIDDAVESYVKSLEDKKTRLDNLLNI